MYFRGKYRLLDPFIPKHGRRIAKVGASKIQIDLSDYIGRTIYMGCYEQQNSRFVQRILRPGDTFIDVGANIGYYSVLAASLVGKSGRVFAFEPFSENFNSLKKNIQLNEYQQVDCLQLGCSDSSKSESIHQADQKLFPNRTASMASSSDVQGISETVNTTTLDQFCSSRDIRSIKLLKIDTDGWDYKILMGARGLLEARSIEYLLIELDSTCLSRIGVDQESVIQFLGELGYVEKSIQSNSESLILGRSNDHLFKKAA